MLSVTSNMFRIVQFLTIKYFSKHLGDLYPDKDSTAEKDLFILSSITIIKDVSCYILCDKS